VKPTADYLRDMLDYVARIEHTVSEGETVFMADYRIQDAVIRQYEVIGEIAKRLPNALLESVPEVNWSQVKGFRDFLAHNYDRVEIGFIWSAVLQLPALRAAIEALLAALPPDDEEA
jgi:hypothetical protein